ncbi:hypothetical protein TWF730_011060 [Orbilia blumenaviensis]|uniref:Uncharacterized protein n=1 Tax=Orbilia blumenaviensis TaxID=1796055 RepID=A0AAV9UJK9_9PEZI
MAELQAQKREFLQTFFQSLGDTVGKNPMLLAAGIPAVATGSVPVVLGALGFGAAGPAAGSLAAAWQSSIGNVASGSLFALAQSIGMSNPLIGVTVGLGLAALSFIIIVYIVDHDIKNDGEIRKFLENESYKVYKMIEGFGSHAAGEVHNFVNSPAVQGTVKGAIEFGGQAGMHVANFGGHAAKGAAGFFGHWMGW